MIRFVLSNSAQALVAAGVVVVFAFTLFKGRRQVSQGCRLPPGPFPLPFVGNLFSIDAKRLWVTYAEWATHYGDIYMVRVLQKNIIVITSERIAKDLLDRWSKVYSDRPYLATREPYGWSFNFAFGPYGDRWRSQRRTFHQVFRAEAALSFRPIQLQKTRQLVSDILNTPGDYYDHIQRLSAAATMSIVYDYEVAPAGQDRFVELFECGNALALGSLAAEVSSIIEAFPFLLSLPEWFPGAVFKRKAEMAADYTMKMIEEPFAYAEKREAAGSSGSTMTVDLLRRIESDDPLQLEISRDSCATAFAGGAEMVSFNAFGVSNDPVFLVQERAQAEIDTVIGTSRLPDYNDRSNLPYIGAILMVTLRKHPVSPLGLPHASIADDIYEGIFILKGCTVLVNTWGIFRNEDLYPEPDVFKPERFLVGGKLRKGMSIDSVASALGGRYTAASSLWVAMASVLSAFKITKARNEQAEEIDFKPTFIYGVTSAPNPFPCSITPRLPNTDILAGADV